MKKKTIKYAKPKKKELSVKTKHVIVAVLGILAVIVLSSAVTVYYYGDKLALYDVISSQNEKLKPYGNSYLQSLAERGIDECSDVLCKSQVGVAVANYDESEEKCKGDSYCLNNYYAEKAVLEKDADYCSKITTEDLKNQCYYTLALLTQNEELCEPITSTLLKDSCFNNI